MRCLSGWNTYSMRLTASFLLLLIATAGTSRAAAESGTQAGDQQRLQAIYQRVHFSQQYPPEAAQYIQAQLQDAAQPLARIAELAKDKRPEVRVLVAMLLGEYGEADGGKILWRLMGD